MFTECHFEGTRVELGGQRYEGCLFKSCELVFDGRPTHLVGCTFDGCHWSFEGAAATTLAFVAELARLDPNVAMALARQFGLVNEQAH